MRDISPESPEARRQRGGKARAQVMRRVGPGTYPFQIIKRVAVGVYNDGFIHAGNLAYMSLVSLFPFFIVAAAVASIFGRTADGAASVETFLYAVPPSVAEVLRGPIEQVLTARADSGLLWLGSLVGLWSAGSLIETIRDILRRAYGTKGGRPFWQYRLGSIGIIMVTVFALMFALSMQVAIASLDQIIDRLPFADGFVTLITASKLVPISLVYLALYYLFLSLTPSAYRQKGFPKWPGALLTAGWWYGTIMLLPWVLSGLGNYDLTYGSLAGVMIALIFFFIVGLGVVIGAELNAALAEPPQEEPAVAALNEAEGGTGK